jgi:methylenetetrahydrofolate dehydrogenase (NADP+)/methenyltetrahydrofolate cyclohydrolase
LAHLLDGKRLAEAIKADVKKEVAALEKKFHRKPTFACIAIGQNPSTCVYCKAQARVADELGIAYRIISLDAEARENDLIAQIARLNSDKDVDALMVQTPLPKGMRRDVVTGFIAPGKDVEGMHPEHLGRLLMGAGDRVVPCTAQACMELLKETGVDFYGKEAVIVGHSEIVGKPLALMLLHRFATVTVCHIATSEAHRLQDHVERADILISAVGKSHVIRGSWVKEGAIVIDVGINRHQERLVGDVEFDAAEKRASYITPVPGGVGPVTVAILMQNVLELIKNEFSR